ncbi:hypothetical protein AURDEDRAFT_64944 [Auricularia subglabra TFB-10046 SS5]|nr:hypothetical protein AURDEDRAFT_64944 [Auricularia subglabra TFB-10046 SS5]
MEAELAAARERPAKRRTKGTSARLDDEILDDCEQSFVAAQEKVTKASKNYYADTGLMALICRHDRVLWVANMTTPGERQHYALVLIRALARELPSNWNIGLLYDIACQLSRSIEKWQLLPNIANRLTFAVSVFHAYGHQWPCQIVFHPRKRDGFGLSDGEGCERFWSAIRHLISCLRVSGFRRRLFLLDRQMQALDELHAWKLGQWLCKRYLAAQRRLAEANDLIRGSEETEIELGRQWEEQVKAQLTKLPRQSQTAADKMIEKILLALGTIDDLKQEIKQDRKELRKSHKLSPAETQKITSRIDAAQEEIDATQIKIESMNEALGTEHCRRLEAMRGNEYLRVRVNARALRAKIRQSLVAHKFEHRKLERAYRHQAKEHSQTKDLVHRRERNITAQVRKFNGYVDQMGLLARQGKKPPGKIRLPRKLDIKKLFKLDVDDHIWQEDPGLGPQGEKDLPRYLSDGNVQRGIAGLLEKRRCQEEMERIEVEVDALGVWCAEETAALSHRQDDVTGLFWQLSMT